MFEDSYKNLSPKLLYHYTSLEVMYKILEQDEMWAGNIRFSNDYMEGIILPDGKNETNDNYAISLSTEGDLLSQWRGYCGNGGVSIEMMFKSEPIRFKIIDKDFDKTGGCIEDLCFPFPVIYLEVKKGQPNEFKKHLEVHKGIELKSFLLQIIPYLKNKHFFEEKEYRLVFSNNDYRLSKCINYRDIGNGSKVPYIKIRPKGEYGITERVPSVEAEFDKDINDILKSFQERNGVMRIIRIPFCANQQSLYEKLWVEAERLNFAVPITFGTIILEFQINGYFLFAFKSL